MRRFTSYGPVNLRREYGVPRTELVDRCVSQLVGEPSEDGHYFTIWGARQAGKTWLMRRAIEEIRARHGDRFLVGTLSMQSVDIEDDGGDRGDQAFFAEVPHLMKDWMQVVVPPLSRWSDWGPMFQRGSAPFDRSVILLISEFDRLPPRIIDKLVGQFRDLYLNRKTSILHGLALIGVRAVLGVDSPRGSPFDVQRSLHVPNLSRDEVVEMFRQYQEDSEQDVEPQVVETLYETTRGQPGLVGWFGELLTEKYNPRPEPIGMKAWAWTYAAACRQQQAGSHARRMNLSTATLTVFVPVSDQAVLKGLSGQRQVDGATVTTIAISWDANVSGDHPPSWPCRSSGPAPGPDPCP